VSPTGGFFEEGNWIGQPLVSLTLSLEANDIFAGIKPLAGTIGDAVAAPVAMAREA